MSQRAAPDLDGRAPELPTDQAVADVTAHLARHLAEYRLDAGLVSELGELCANWGLMVAVLPRKTTAEIDAPIIRVQAAARALQEAIAALSISERFRVSLRMVNEHERSGEIAPVPRLEDADFLPRLIEASAALLKPGSAPFRRSPKSPRPPAHHADAFVGLIAIHAKAHGVPVTTGPPFVTIVDACLTAAEIRKANGKALDALPLVKKQVQYDRQHRGNVAGTQAVLSLLESTVKR